MRLTIEYGGKTESVELSAPELISKTLERRGIVFPLPCSGAGRCGKCRVTVRGSLSEPTAAERAHLSEEQLEASLRLACQTVATGDAVVSVPQRDGAEILLDSAADAFMETAGQSGLGLAVDIGTTTVAAYLCDMGSGAVLASGGTENPQAQFGADVISRIESSMAGEGAALSTLIKRAIAGLAAGLLKQAGREAGELSRTAIVGNTAMLYLFCGLDPTPLAAAPFVPDTLFGRAYTAEELGLEGFPKGAEVCLGRSISAYVGADITAAVLACRMCEGKGPAFLVDIGTNGEMALWCGGKLYCCSTAAGPAFEGVGISCGLPAQSGAVSHVSDDGAALHCEVIGGGAAKGVCGSGLIDAAAAFLRLGLVDETGRIDEERAGELGVYIDGPGGGAIEIVGELTLTQRDIRQLQLAKAAVRAGAETLLHSAGINAGELAEFYIAGGFGSGIDIQSAARVGILPRECTHIAKAVGNAAGAGARLMLVSEGERRRAQELAAGAQTVELSASAYFMEKYVDCMSFE